MFDEKLKFDEKWIYQKFFEILLREEAVVRSATCGAEGIFYVPELALCHAFKMAMLSDTVFRLKNPDGNVLTEQTYGGKRVDLTVKTGSETYLIEVKTNKGRDEVRADAYSLLQVGGFGERVVLLIAALFPIYATDLENDLRQSPDYAQRPDAGLDLKAVLPDSCKNFQGFSTAYKGYQKQMYCQFCMWRVPRPKKS